MAPKNLHAKLAIPWLLGSVVAGAINVVVMQMFAASMLGPTPYFLPFFLALLCLMLVIGSASVAIGGHLGREDTNWPFWISCIIFGLLVFYNVDMMLQVAAVA